MTTSTQPPVLLDEPPDGTILGRFEGEWLSATFFRNDKTAEEDIHPAAHHWYVVDPTEDEPPVPWEDVATLRPGERLVRLYREDGIAEALAWIAEEYRRCVVAARCSTNDHYYATCNGRAEAYRQAAAVLAEATGTKAPDSEQIKRDVPADGIYRTEAKA